MSPLMKSWVCIGTFMVLMIVAFAMERSSPAIANKAWLLITIAFLFAIYQSTLRCPQCRRWILKEVIRGRQRPPFRLRRGMSRACANCGYDLSKSPK